MEYFFGFVVLLGVLVFIHELGHFSVAKACGVRVDTFSIGMGKKIFRFVKGETEYVLSLIPLGGYVKLLGQDPREEVPAELNHRSFRIKPLWQRAAIVLAGPAFNAILAVGVFVGLYLVGVPSPGPVLERVLPGSPAEIAGFKSGDLVLNIKEIASNSEAKRILDLSDLEKYVGKRSGQELVFEIERTNPQTQQKSRLSLTYTPTDGNERDSTVGVISKRGVIAGVERNAPAPVVVWNSKSSWATENKIPNFFWVESIELLNTEAQPSSFKIESLFDLERAWDALYSISQNPPVPEVGARLIGTLVSMEASGDSKKPQEPQQTQVEIQLGKNFPNTLQNAGLTSSELVLVAVSPGTPAESLGLSSGDLIQTLNGEPVKSFQWFRNRLQELAANKDTSVKVGWLRDGKPFEAEVSPQKVDTEDPLTEVKKSQFQIGAAFLALPAPPTLVTVKADGFFDAVNIGVERTWNLTGSMLSSFYHLAVGDISPKTLGGPLLIAKISGESMKQGAVPFFRMMAFISLNLFILNLLPLPVLDGGHLILYCVEAIRRKPLSIKVIEIWTTAGFFLLMGLVAVVFFNDLSRLGLFKIFSS